MNVFADVSVIDADGAGLPPSFSRFYPPAHPNDLRAVLARSRTGFTLVEMLVVMAIILVLITLATPALNALSGGADFTKSAYNLMGTLDQARAYAMANNTHVFVGITEVDAVSSSTTSGGSGRVVVAMVAARDGTRGYDVDTPGAWTANYATVVQNLRPVAGLQQFPNLHLADFGGAPPTGKMARPPCPVTPFNYSLGAPGCVSTTPFDWPLGAPLGSGQYSFAKVIDFDPQGVARVQIGDSADAVAKCMEIGLQPTHGNAIPALPQDQNVGNQAAIQISSVTGATHLYRP